MVTHIACKGEFQYVMGIVTAVRLTKCYSRCHRMGSLCVQVHRMQFCLGLCLRPRWKAFSGTEIVSGQRVGHSKCIVLLTYLLFHFIRWLCG